MAQIYGLHAHNFKSGTEELIAVWKQGTVHRVGSAWRRGPGINLTASKDTYMASFLDQVFLVNYTDNNWNYQENFWSQTNNLGDSPIAQYIASHQVRIFLYKIKIAGVEYPSRCWFTDLPKNNKLTWGLETGTNLVQTASSAVITSIGSLFITRNIKVGDPFIITSGTNLGEYTVQSVDSETQITLTKTLTYTTSGSSFWVGGNWFDVETDDGDLGTGIGVTSNEVYFFKKNSVHRYNVSGKELRKVDMPVGTTSPRSIISKGEYVYCYHPSGIWRIKGVSGQMISLAIEDVISGVADGFNPVAWKNEITDEINFYLGDVTLRNGETITKCVAVFDENAETWSLKSYDKQIVVATNWLHTGVPEIYAGSTNNDVYQLDNGNAFDGSEISFRVDTKVLFPEGTESLLNFTRLRLYIDNGHDIHVMYKLFYKPSGNADIWTNDSDWKTLQGTQAGEKAEWHFPSDARASGIQLSFIESSLDESFLLEKFVLYYNNQANY